MDAQLIYDSKNRLIDQKEGMTATLARLRELAGRKGDITVQKGRISAYVKPFKYGADNASNLVAYAVKQQP